MALVAATALTACSDSTDSAGARREVVPAATLSASFLPRAAAGPQPVAVTYNTTAVPVLARVVAKARRVDGGTEITLSLNRLLPNHDYSAHVHTKPCGVDPMATGPHYQNVRAPQTPTVDPRYANPGNEIWLDFTSDPGGDAQATTTVTWAFRPKEAHSLVLHPQRTATHAGHAGTSGERVACVGTKDLEAAWVKRR